MNNLRCRSKSVEALLDTVPKRNPSGRVYIIIHSLDAPSLRSTAEQDALSQLSACQNVHIAATVDHVNSAALFDARQRDVFRWVWHEVSTHESYWLETMAAPPVLADAAQHETKQSASVVLSMLTPSSRAVRPLRHDMRSPMTRASLMREAARFGILSLAKRTTSLCIR